LPPGSGRLASAPARQINQLQRQSGSRQAAADCPLCLSRHDASRQNMDALKQADIARSILSKPVIPQIFRP
jgi:hypothetical protein